MTLRTIASRCLPLLGCLVLLGCGGKDYSLAPVSGRVTLDGHAVAGIQISFQPVGQGKADINPGPGSFAFTDAEGRYQLETVEPTEPGAVVGTHHVRFSPPNDGASSDDDLVHASRLQLAPKYTDGSLTFKVPPEGTDKADFDLTSR